MRVCDDYSMPEDGIALGTLDISDDDTGTEVPDCRTLDVVWFDLAWTAADTPTGTLSLMASIDGSTWRALELSSAMIHTIVTASLTAAGGLLLDGTGVGSVRVAVADAPNHLRWDYTHAADGTADTVTIHCWGH